MQTRHLLFCLLAGTALAACNREPTPTDTAPDTTAPAPAAATAPAYTFNDDITAADFAQLVKTLASDEFEGRGPGTPGGEKTVERSEEHTSELQSLMRISYAVFCLKKKNRPSHTN